MTEVWESTVGPVILKLLVDPPGAASVHVQVGRESCVLPFGEARSLLDFLAAHFAPGPAWEAKLAPVPEGHLPQETWERIAEEVKDDLLGSGSRSEFKTDSPPLNVNPEPEPPFGLDRESGSPQWAGQDLVGEIYPVVPEPTLDDDTRREAKRLLKRLKELLGEQ